VGWSRILAAASVPVAIGGLVAGCGGETKTVTTTGTDPAMLKSGVGAPAKFTQFGTINSLRRTGKAYELRFDPAWMLSGVTASAAAAEDGVVQPGEPVPDDYYVLDEGHRLLTYSVPADAHVTVLADGVQGTDITVAELAELVQGTSKKQLFEPISTGFWILVDGDTVLSLDQQYRP
jgi:hypothetical protein